MKMNKKIISTALGALLVFGAWGSAFAADDTTPSTSPQPTKQTTAKKESRGPKGGVKLETLAAEKGITVDELKTQLEQERQAKLEAQAAEQGITVDELKAKLE
ncbi:hypothetical protein D3C73_393310 [compost metagenome]